MTGCCVERTDDQLGADDELDAKKNLEEAEKGLRICSKMADKEELFFFFFGQSLSFFSILPFLCCD